MNIDDLLFLEEIVQEGLECNQGHPLRIVAEGYAICYGQPLCYAWRLTPPGVGEVYRRRWGSAFILRGGNREHAWVTDPLLNREMAIRMIKEDIMLYANNDSFDEEAERERLIPV